LFNVKEKTKEKKINKNVEKRTPLVNHMKPKIEYKTNQTKASGKTKIWSV
jgi:hypothetical protein